MSNIRELVLENDWFRRILFISPQREMEITAQALVPGEQIGPETHAQNVQFFSVEAGSMWLNGQQLLEGESMVVVSGQEHLVVAGEDGVKFMTIYVPADHQPTENIYRQ